MSYPPIPPIPPTPQPQPQPEFNPQPQPGHMERAQFEICKRLAFEKEVEGTKLLFEAAVMSCDASKQEYFRERITNLTDMMLDTIVDQHVHIRRFLDSLSGPNP
jgi:hypothetical protein